MKKVAVVGATGYTGVELLRLLVMHPGVEISCVTSRSNDGTRVDEMFPSLRGFLDLPFTVPDDGRLAEADVVFFATPNGVAMDSVPALLKAGTRVIDLAADFRIRDAGVWSQWYGMQHACPELIAEAVYGLPELNREAIRTARLVANPGCYPTAVTLGFLPLVERGLVELDSLIADAKSGASGAGRKASVANLLCEAGDSFKAYGVAGHRHLPEISQNLRQISGVDALDLVFVPHLLPMIRGIHATLYARLTHGFQAMEPADLQAIYEQRYARETFVDVLPPGSHPETRSVRGANLCRMAVHRPQNGRRVVVLSVIDNLVKGAAGQAVQNMNLMLGFQEETGLRHPGLLP
ncbi:MAG: N-acetyl-gamma-glutamyl-phosphate reductase [Thiothrix sp.]|nr:N-acetyl-gamma-glutamyl-phosphate reductase [Thiothrix sp.]HPQ94160.1 N-acetyl-gamma-glutamyl-phosphate reductase [Thiolinea sp.]